MVASAKDLEQKLLGLFELDDDGIVLYSSVDPGDGYLYRARDLDGSDFFTDVAHFSNAVDFQRCFDLFRFSEIRAHSFRFTCQYEDGPHPVKVVMARLLRDSSHCSFLLHMQRPS